jgi:hypothetical protein
MPLIEQFPTRVERELGIAHLPSYVTLADLVACVSVLHVYPEYPHRADLTVAFSFDNKVVYPASKEQAEYLAKALARAARQVNDVYQLGLE